MQVRWRIAHLLTSERLSLLSSASRQRSRGGSACAARATGGASWFAGDRSRFAPREVSGVAADVAADLRAGRAGSAAAGGGAAAPGSSAVAACACRRHAAVAVSHADASSGEMCTGSRRVKAAPCPGVLATVTSPPARRAHARAMKSPDRKRKPRADGMSHRCGAQERLDCACQCEGRT